MQETGKSLRREAWKTFTPHAKPLLAVGFGFITVAIGAIAVNALLPSTFLITVPMIVLPFLFCFQIASSRLRHEGHLDFKEYYHFFGLGLSPKFRKPYRFLGTFLLALLILVAALIVSGLIASYIVPVTDHAFAAAATEMTTMLENDATYEEVMAYATNHADVIMPVVNAIITSSVAAASTYFIFTILSRMPAVVFSWNTALDGSFIAALDKALHIEQGPRLRHLFLAAIWPGLLLYLGGFALGIGIGWVVLPDAWALPVFGMVMGLLFLWPFLPTAVLIGERLYEVLHQAYFTKMSERLKELIQQYSLAEGLSPEEEAQLTEIKKMTADLEKKLAEEKQKEDEKNPPPETSK